MGPCIRLLLLNQHTTIVVETPVGESPSSSTSVINVDRSSRPRSVSVKSVDELHRDRAGRQRDAEVVGQFHHDVQILVIQATLDAGIEVAPRHPVAEEVEHAARGHALQHRLADAADVKAAAAGEGQGLCDALRGHEQQQLVTGLRRLPGAVVSHVEHLRADAVEQRPGALEGVGLSRRP